MDLFTVHKYSSDKDSNSLFVTSEVINGRLVLPVRSSNVRTRPAIATSYLVARLVFRYSDVRLVCVIVR